MDPNGNEETVDDSEEEEYFPLTVESAQRSKSSGSEIPGALQAEQWVELTNSNTLFGN